MKKRVLSLFMALALCLTLLPTAALAEGTEGTAQTPPAVEKAADPANGEEQQENQPAAPKQENQSAEQEEQQEDSAAKQAAATVQALIDALPAVDELDGMDDDDAMAVYEAFQAACDAYYDTLTEEQQAQLKNTEKLAALSKWFNAQVAPLAWSGDIFPDTVDANGNIIRHTSWRRNGPIYEGSNGDASFTDAQFYVVQGNDVTIGGNLTIGGSCALILCQGAKLTVEGALICSGSYSIYGQSDVGAYAGRLVVKNSLDDGAAIRSDSTYPPSLGIYSGELEIHSGNSDKLVDGVKLSSTSHIHQGTLDGTAVSPEVWGADSLKGGTLTLAYCQHEHSADQELIPDSGGTAHHRHCKACGFDWASEACDFNNPDHYVPNPEDKANTHFSVCECGNVSTTPAKHEPTTIPTDDGKGHTQRCMCCLYTSTENNPVEEHHYNVNGECENCGFKPAARDAAGNLYESVGDALKAAEGGSWVMLETHAEDGGKELSEEIEFNDPGRTVELKMNGYTLTNSGNPTLTVENGTLKITGDATINQTGTFSDLAAPAVKVTGGRVIFEGNLTATGANGKPAVKVTGGTLRLKAGDVLNGGVSVAGSTTYANVNALLGENLAFAKVGETSAIVKGDVTSISENVTVVAHTHDFKLNSDGKYTCACGYTCPHNDFKDGKCTICGNRCAHTDVGDDGVCRNCQTQMAVKITASDSTVTYSTDFKSAMRNATNGTKITLLADVSIANRTGISGDNTTVTLDLNKHKITGGWLDVGGKDTTNGTYTACTLKIIGKGSYEPPMYGGIITVNMKATLDLSEWEGGTISSINISDNSNYEAATREAAVIVGPKAGTIGNLSFGNNQLDELKKTKLSGGSFNEIWVADFGPVKLGELLADGYAFQNGDGSYVKYETTLQGASIYNVTVVKCLHAKINEDGHCAYCNATGFVAQVTAADGSSSAYTDIAAAIAAADGGTVKLLANAGEITISSPLKLGLNGKTAAKLTVTGDVTLASLLPEGYTFKSGSAWISDLSGTELTNVSMAKIPIKSMNYPTEMSMTYGDAGTLLVNVKKESGTGAVRFQWYKVEDGKATEVGSATAKNQFDLSALKLPAGQHTFRFSATCDGYKKMSQDIAVTVQRASISASRITPPTAQENLTYTGQEQALITAGSVMDYGTMQYSLTENGTYSQDIPAGTDAGTYTVWYRVIGDANHNDTAPASVVVSIGKKPLTLTEVTAVSKPYDGTTNAGVTSVTFDGVTLIRGTDYNVTASFEDASVGNNKMVTAAVTLTGQTAKNYALEQSSFPTTGSITKAAAPDFTRETALVIVNDCEKTYTVTLPTLPTLETPKEYGAPTYELGEIKLNGGYYTGGAKVENGKLTLPIQKNDVETTGSVGTVTVVIKSTNYEDITLTVNVSAKNKIKLTPVGTITATPITYGDTLSKSKISGKMKDLDTGKEVEGTFAWKNKYDLPIQTGDWYVDWTFTPDESYGGIYATATGIVKVPVAPKSIEGATITLEKYEFAYNAAEQSPKITGVTLETWDGTRITYVIKSGDKATDVSDSITLTIEGTGNYTGRATVKWKITPKTVTPTIEVAACTYTGDALEPTVTIKDDIGNIIDPKEYEIFYSNNTNAGTATVTIKDVDGGNYVLSEASKAFEITKAAAPAAEAGSLTITNGLHETYSLDLSTLLPKLTAPCDYGTIIYDKKVDAHLGVGTFVTLVNGKTGELTLEANRSGTDEGQFGTITVTISTSNYQDITLTIHVSAKNRITPTGTPTLSKNAITYGDALNTIALSGKLHDNVNNVDVDGTFEWVDGTHIPVVGNGTYAAEWIFEPTDTEKYLTVSGRSNITVEKAQQYGKVSMAGYTYGQTPSTPTLTDRTGDGSVTYYYSTTNSNSGGTKWENIQADTLNAGTYYMYAELGETENYDSFTTACEKFRVLRAMPTCTKPTGLTAIYGQTLADVKLPDDWSWMDSGESVGNASTAAKKFKAKFTPADTTNYNMVENIELEVLVNKADGRNLKTVELEQKYTDASEHTYTPDWSGLPSEQTWRYSSEYSVSTGSNVTLTKQDFVADGSLLTYAVSGGKAGDKITITLKASCDNYGDFTITLNIPLTEKDDQKPLTITGADSVVYGQTLTLTTTGGTGSGAVTYRIDTAHSTGEATIDPNTGVLTPVKVGSVSVIATKAGDNDYNDVTSAPFVLMIKPATSTGEPKYTKITTSGKTLKDATLTIEGSTLSPNDGKLEWVDDKGNVLPDSTRVEANTTYKWRFTPTDTNYTTLTGEIELYRKSSSGGGGWYYSYYTIQATAGSGGSISPSGNVSVREGGDQTFTITPDKGYAVANVKIDGKSIGAVKSYTFENVRRTHTIEVIFVKGTASASTGDSSNLPLWSALLLASTLTLAGAVHYKRKRAR